MNVAALSTKVHGNAKHNTTVRDIYGLTAAALLNALNRLRFASTDWLTNTLTGTGTVTYTIADGTVDISCPANNDDAEFNGTDKIALSLLPRIAVYRVESITFLGANTICAFGFAAAAFSTVPHYAAVFVTATGSSFRTNAAATTTTAITAIAAGDVIVIYATSGRCVCYLNGVMVAAHTTNLPTNPVSHAASIYTSAGEGAGCALSLNFMG